jgi:hypothetical protein
MPIQGVDLTRLASLDPSVEDVIFGCELMRGFEAELGQLRRNDKCPELLQRMILDGAPHSGRRDSTSRGDEPRRRQRIKQMLNRLLGR